MKQFLLCAGVLLLHLQLFSQNLETGAETYSEPDSDETLDNTSTPAQVYLINGEKTTFDNSLADGQRELLGVWEGNDSEIQRINFSDSESVVVTFSDGQLKGKWTVMESRLIIYLKTEIELGSGKDEIILFVEGVGTSSPTLIHKGNKFDKTK